MTETNTSHTQTIGNMNLNRTQLNNLQRLINININPKISAKHRLQTSLELLLNQINATQGSIILLDERLEYYKIVASSQKGYVDSQKNVTSKSIIGHVCKNKKPIFIKNLNKKEHSSPREKQNQYQSVIAYPIISSEDKLLGILNAINYFGDDFFSEADFKLATTFMLILTPIVENCVNSKELTFGSEENKDILSEILTGKGSQKEKSDIEQVMEYYKEVETEPEQKTLSDFVSKPDYQNKGKTKRKTPKKKKSTCYLSGDLVKDLEDAKTRIKQEAPHNIKSKISKSQIISFALKTILNDYKSQKKDSLLMQTLLSEDKE